MDAANTYPKNHTDAVQVFCFKIQARVGNGFVSHSHGILGIQVHLAGFLAVDELRRIEVLYLTRELCLEFGRIKMSNRPCPAYSVDQVFPEFGNGIAKRRERTKTCYYYSF